MELENLDDLIMLTVMFMDEYGNRRQVVAIKKTPAEINDCLEKTKKRLSKLGVTFVASVINNLKDEDLDDIDSVLN